MSESFGVAGGAKSLITDEANCGNFVGGAAKKPWCGENNESIVPLIGSPIVEWKMTEEERGVERGGSGTCVFRPLRQQRSRKQKPKTLGGGAETAGTTVKCQSRVNWSKGSCDYVCDFTFV